MTNGFLYLKIELRYFFRKDTLRNLVWWGMDWLCNFITISTLLVCCYFLVRFFLIESYAVPSSSMEPTLLAGDQVCVFKPIYGPRIFEDWEVFETGEFRYRRLSGFGSVKHNDVVVINRFSKHQNVKHNGIGVFYIKRCIGLPGDTLRIENGFYKSSGTNETLGILEKQQELSRTPAEEIDEYNCYTGTWNIHNFGPLYIPKAGDTVPIDSITAFYYREAIEAEVKQVIEVRDGEVFLGDTPCRQYTFRENCYFFAGDNVLDSNDGRYWGVISEQEIVAKAFMIWNSSNPATGKTRWSRLFKFIY